MPKAADFKPTKRIHNRAVKWSVNIPAAYSGTGRRSRRFFDTKKRAEEFLESLTSQVDNLGRSVSQLSAKQTADAANAVALLKKTGVNLTQAVESYLERRQEMQASIPLGSAFDQFIDAPTKRKRSPKHLKALGQTRKLFKDIEHLLVVDVQAQDIDRILKRKGDCMRNLCLRHLRAVLNLCVKRGQLEENPVNKIEFTQLESKEIQIFTPDQVRALLDAAISLERRLVPYLSVGFFAGIRPEELVRMNWEDINQKEGHVKIRAEISKTKRRRIVEIQPVLDQWLDWWKKSGGLMTGSLVPFSPETLKRSRKSIANKAEVKWIQDGPRKCFASAHLATFEHIDRTAIQLGHTRTTMLFQHYNQAMTKKDAAAYWAISPPELSGKVVLLKVS